MQNVGTLDRGLRLVAGLALLAAALFAGWPVGGAAWIVALVIGGVLVATAAAGFCPAYRLLGIKTCRAR